jgi:rhodanese-related sulfurtransferase
MYMQGKAQLPQMESDIAMLNLFRSSGPKVGRIAPVEAIARAKAGTLTLLDVREIGELQASGKAKGAVHIPLGLVGLKADPKAPDCDKRLATDKAVAVYCMSGGRSGRAAEILLGLGYAEVYNLGGMGDWVAAGGPVERV